LTFDRSFTGLSNPLFKRFCQFLLLFSLLAVGSLSAVVSGWYRPEVVSRGVSEYALASGGDLKKGPLLVLVRQLNEFSPSEEQRFSIELVYGATTRIAVVKVKEVVIPPLQLLFSLNPTVSVGDEEVMVVWQEPSRDKPGLVLRYLILSTNGFKVVSEGVVDKDSYDGSLPHLVVDTEGKFHLFYQKKGADNRFSLVHSPFSRTGFDSGTYIIKNLNFVGKGVFFPSVIMGKGGLHVVYQSRDKETLQDELYYLNSQNLGKSFSKPLQLTQNNLNDFAPYLNMFGDKVEYVWQSNTENGWQIFYSTVSGEAERITTTKANCYQPVLTHLEKQGRVIAWLDQRVTPFQIFARFPDLPEDRPQSKEHQVSFQKESSAFPALAPFEENAYLFYISNNTLYRTKSDFGTSEIKLASSSHPKGKVSQSTTLRISWTLDDEPSGVEGYATFIDDKPDTIPNIYNVDGNETSVVKSGLKGGEYYFHIRYRDKVGNESPVYRYHFFVDATIPTMAEIVSASHPTGAPGSSTSFQVEYSALDDIAVKGYRYTLSQDLSAEPDKYTESSSLSLTVPGQGRWYFIIKAIDQSGKSSIAMNYPFDVAAPDATDFSVATNITEGKIEKDEFVSISVKMLNPEKTPLAIYAGVSIKGGDPFTAGKKIPLKKVGDDYVARIPMSGYKANIYNLSLGLDYVDQSRSYPRQFRFAYHLKESVPKKPIWKFPKSWFTNPDFMESLKPSIEVTPRGNMFEVRFSFSPREERLIKGFSYVITSMPEIPGDEINYTDQPIYLVNLKKGVYYINVKPIFKNDKANDLSNYAFQRLEVTDGFWRDEYLYLILLLGSIVGVWLLYDRLRFMVSRFG